MSNCYFETLGAAIFAFAEYVREQFGEFERENPEGEIAAAFNGGVSYGQTVSRSFELASLKGKKTKKWAHITLYRMESGRYELTNYIL